MYAVVGSTGQVGGATVRALRAKGKEVRALVRDNAKAPQVEALGAEPFLASVEDGARLERAFEGAEGVFIMVPPLYKSPNPRSENALAVAAIAHAVQAARVPRIVFLSSIGSQHDEGTGLILHTYDLEQALFALNVEQAAIRAASFMQNMLPLLTHVERTGTIPASMGHSPLPYVSTEDIGKLAADLLTGQWSGKRIIEFEGPRAYSTDDVAAVLSERFGRSIQAEFLPPEVQQANYEKFGFSEAFGRAMNEMAEGFNSGHIRFEGGSGVEHLRGAITLEEALGGSKG